MSTRDDSRPVRDEDVFDVGAVAAWLREHAHEVGRADDLAGIPEVRQFPGGASNLTYLLSYPSRDLVLRRPPRGMKARGAHDMRREFTVQARLRPVFPLVAEMVAFCDDRDVIGFDFYVMGRIEGTILRRDPPAGLALTPTAARRLCTGFLDVLVDLHAVDPSAAGLEDLGRGTGYVARQVDGWTRRFREARTPDVGDYEPVMGWLAEHRPEDTGSCGIHNDFRLDNVVLARSDRSDRDGDRGDHLRVVGVLDWEMATLGDPLMDLGGA